LQSIVDDMQLIIAYIKHAAGVVQLQ